MKKLVTLVFVLAAVMVGTNVFTSCKDYDSDSWNDQSIENKKLHDLIDETMDSLRDTRDALLDSLDTCSARCDKKFKALHDSVASLREADRKLDTLIQKLQSADSVIWDSLNAEVNARKSDVHRLDSIANAQAAEIAKLKANDSIYNALVDKIDTLLNATVDSLARVTSDLAIVTSQVNTLLGTTIPTIQSDLLAAAAKAEDAYALALKDSIYNAELAALIDSVCDVVDSYKEKNDARVDSLAEVTAELGQLIAEAEANRKYADELLQKQINLLVLSLDEMIADVNEAYKAADAVLQQEIDALEDRVKANEDAIKALEPRVDAVEDAIKKLITGIIPQQVVNPVYGTFSAPVGISSRVLMAFYGKNVGTPVFFPTSDPAHYVKNSQQLTDADLTMIDLGREDLYHANGNADLIAEEAGNAGTIYLTVNPAEVDFAGQTLTLVNSKDEESKVALTALEKENDYEIKFGYTRSAENNGFYKAQATLSADDINSVKININSELKSTFKELLQQRKLSKVGELALNVYDQFNGLLPAQALKATWETTEADGTTAQHSIRSEYALAATAIQPLSYSFLEDLHVTTVPGYDRAISLVDRVAKKVKESLNISISGQIVDDIKGLELKHIELTGLDEELLAKFVVTIDEKFEINGVLHTISPNQSLKVVVENAVSESVTVPTLEIVNGVAYAWLKADAENGDAAYVCYKAENVVMTEDGVMVVYSLFGEPTYYNDGLPATVDIKDIFYYEDETFSFEKTIDLREAVEELYENMEGSIEDVNGMIDDLRKIVDDINELLDDSNGFLAGFDTKVDNAKSKIQSVIDRINSKLANVINSANQRIQPVLLLTAENTGTKRVSRAKNLPTALKEATVSLIPTSYTAEIITPAFKKHIAVTNVFKGDKSAQGGDAACKTALANVNKQINKVVSGSTTSMSVTFEKGYVYEVAYSALDYSGKISMHKYYVQY